MTEIDIAAADHLLMTTKQVRKRMDFTRPVPRQLLLDCIEVASRAPMGGNLERNRWMVIDDKEVMAKIAPFYQSIGRAYLKANQVGDVAERQAKVIDSAMYLVDHIAEAPAWVIAMRLDRLPANASNGAYLVIPPDDVGIDRRGGQRLAAAAPNVLRSSHPVNTGMPSTRE